MTIIGDIAFLGYLVTAALAFVLGFGRLIKHQLADQLALAGLISDGASFDPDAEPVTTGFKRLVYVSYAFAGLFFIYLLVAGTNGWGVPSSMAYFGSFFGG